MPTLEELDGEDWGEPNYASHLVMETHRLRRVPIEDFTAENLRIMIGQNFSLEYLVPKAMELLRRDPLASGDLYEGDLLRTVVRCKAEYLDSQPALKRELARISLKAVEMLESNSDRELREDFRAFAEDVLKALDC
jgi:hypothetical protein